jgi:hypothetical protein
VSVAGNSAGTVVADQVKAVRDSWRGHAHCGEWLPSVAPPCSEFAEAARGSFESDAAAIARATGAVTGKRQVEELARRAAADIGYISASHDADLRLCG